MRRFAILMVAVALLVSAMPSAGLAQTDDEGPLMIDPTLPAGPWLGFGTLAGTTTTDHGGVHFEYTGDYTSGFDFVVTTEGTTTGNWDIQGPMRLLGTGSDAVMDAIGEISGGGSMSGDGINLAVAGSTTTTGVVTLTAAGRTFTEPVANSSTAPTIDIVVDTTFCNEAYGNWTMSFNETLEDYTWQPTFQGSWVAVRQVEAFGELDVLAQNGYVEGLTEIIFEFLAGFSPGSPNRKFVGFTTISDWSEINDLLVRAEALINELRNLTPCNRELIGDESVEFWLQILTEGINALIEQAWTVGGLDGSQIRFLMNIGLRTGAIGAGSLFDNGEDLVFLLTGEAIALVEEWYECECDVPPDVIDLFVLGSQMGWEYKVGDQFVPASQLLAMAPDMSSIYPEDQ